MCFLLAQILTPKIFLNRKHLEQSPALKPLAPSRVLQLSSGISCLSGGHPTQFLLLLPALSQAYSLHGQLPSLSVLPESLSYNIFASPDHAGALLHVLSPSFPTPWHGVQLLEQLRAPVHFVVSQCPEFPLRIFNYFCSNSFSFPSLKAPSPLIHVFL